jgi:hypothetical protein
MAINILKTILVDISCLIYNVLSEKTFLPCLLIHDSPREADLQIVHYNRIFELIYSIQNQFEAVSDSCPFQYIVTTTTKPPALISEKFYPVESFDASIPEKMFLKCRIEQEYKKIVQTIPLIEKNE